MWPETQSQTKRTRHDFVTLACAATWTTSQSNASQSNLIKSSIKSVLWDEVNLAHNWVESDVCVPLPRAWEVGAPYHSKA